MDPDRGAADAGRAPAGAGERRSRGVAFAVVTAGYMAATAAESLLAPLYPVLSDELGLDLRVAGLAFGLLAAAVSVGNVAGGWVLLHGGPKAGALLGLGVAAAAAGLAAASGSRSGFLASQVLLGLGSGLYFASGLTGAALLAGERRRGLGMGMFGVAFSAGLALAAGLAAVGALVGWRVSFVGVAVVTALTGAALTVVAVPRPARPPQRRPRPRFPRTLAVPLLVGGVAATSQYGTVAFLPAFAVTAWGLSPPAAAAALAVARLISVPAKLVSGRSADRAGAARVARWTGIALVLVGGWWTLGPGPGLTLWAAVAFAALVSALGPLANLMAFQGFGERGPLLGAYRSVQIALGALAGVTIGELSAALGLRPALAIAALAIPATLVPLGWKRRAPGPRAEGAPSGRAT